MTDEELEEIGFKIFSDKWEIPFALFEGRDSLDRLKAGVEGAKYILSKYNPAGRLDMAWPDELDAAIQNLKTFLGEDDEKKEKK